MVVPIKLANSTCAGLLTRRTVAVVCWDIGVQHKRGAGDRPELVLATRGRCCDAQDEQDERRYATRSAPQDAPTRMTTIDLDSVLRTVGEAERSGSDAYPEVSVRAMYEAGVVRAPFPAELGGAGWSLR